MIARARRVIVWFTRHPHTLSSGVVGFVLGLMVMLPFGWKLPDAAASLIGALLGAAAAVSGALWAANAKQDQEDKKADERQRNLASMIAAAVIPEIVGASRNMILIADQLDDAIRRADTTQDTSAVLGVLGGSSLGAALCQRYMDRFEAFGADAAIIVEAVGAILDINSMNLSLVGPINELGWDIVRDVVIARSRMARGYAGHLKNTIKVLARHHPRSAEIEQWADLPSVD